jgi:peptide/nickel transport system ATP-binding protein
VPEPDVSRRLDFDALMQGKASDPAAWPREFRIDAGQHPALQQVGEEHYVRAAA